MQSPQLDAYAGTGSWQYDPVQGKLVRKPVTAGG
jgi:hypothetical protein